MPHADTPRGDAFPSLPFKPASLWTSAFLAAPPVLPVSPPVPNRRDRRRTSCEDPSAFTNWGCPPDLAALDVAGFQPSRPAPTPPKKAGRRSHSRLPRLRVPFNPPEKAGLWTISEEPDAEHLATLFGHSSAQQLTEPRAIGLGLPHVPGWDTGSECSSRFSTPSPSPRSIDLELGADEASDAAAFANLFYSITHQALASPDFDSRKSSMAAAAPPDDDDLWEYTFVMGPSTPLKDSFGNSDVRDSMPNQLPLLSRSPARTPSPGRRPPPLNLDSAKQYRHQPRRLLSPMASPVSTPTRASSARVETCPTALLPALPINSPPALSISGSSICSFSPATPAHGSAQRAEREVQVSPVTDAGQASFRDLLAVTFPVPPKRGRAGSTASATKSASHASSKARPLRSLSPTDQRILTNVPGYQTPSPKTTQRPPVPPLPAKFRSTPQGLRSPAPRRVTPASSMALQIITGMLDDEDQAGSGSERSRSFGPSLVSPTITNLPCPVLTPALPSRAPSFSSRSSAASSASQDLPRRPGLPDMWMPRRSASMSA